MNRTVPGTQEAELKKQNSGSAAGLAQFFVEAEVFGEQAFDDVDNLAVVQAEVLDDLVDGVETAHVVALNFIRSEQFVNGEAVKDFGGFVERGTEAAEQVGGREPALRSEFGRPVAQVVTPIERINKPLAHIAVEMQQQIADAV